MFILVRIVKCILSAYLLGGCGEGQDHYQSKYLLGDGGELTHAPLAEKVFEVSIRICLEGSIRNSEKIGELVISSVSNWLRPLREVYPAIAEDVVIDCSAPDAYLEVNRRISRARAFPAQSKIVVYPEVSLEVLTHEFGHLFGLADTYKSVSGHCPGQPESIMCEPSNKLLSDDDVEGLRFVVSKLHPNAERYPNCPKESFEKYARRIKVEFRLPESEPGTKIRFERGRKSRYRFPWCRSLWWSELEFTCNRGSWQEKGIWGRSSRCRDKNLSQPYLFNGAL